MTIFELRSGNQCAGVFRSFKKANEAALQHFVEHVRVVKREVSDRKVIATGARSPRVTMPRTYKRFTLD